MSEMRLMNAIVFILSVPCLLWMGLCQFKNYNSVKKGRGSSLYAGIVSFIASVVAGIFAAAILLYEYTNVWQHIIRYLRGG
jgi:hypothetical protein